MNARAYSILLLASLTVGSNQKIEAGSWNSNLLTIGAVLGVTGLAYWYFKPLETAELKAFIEKTFEETKARYYNALHSREKIKTVRAIGSTYSLGFWKSIFTGNDNKLGSDAQHNSPLLRGTSLMYYDANILQEQLRELDNRFGSRSAAQREFINYDAVAQLVQQMHEIARDIETSSEYFAAEDAFRQFRETKKLQEATLSAVQDMRYHNRRYN